MSQYATIAATTAVALTLACALTIFVRRYGLAMRSLARSGSIQAIGDNLPNGWIARVIQRPDGQIHLSYISAGFERLTGYSKMQIHTQPDLLDRAVNPEDSWRLREAVRQALRNLTPFEVEIRFITASGSCRWLQINAVPRRLRNGAIRWDGIQLDITARKIAEETQRAKESAYRALALEHSRLYSEARRQAAELETLHEASAIVAGTLDISEAIERILEQLARVMPYDSASVQLRRGDESEIIGCRGFSQPEQVIGRRFPVLDNPLCQSVYGDGQAQILSETSTPEGLSLMNGRPIRSWLALPLMVGEQVIGMLTLDSATPGHFTAAHGRLGMAFATQVAIALKHAQSYRREVRARQRLIALQQAAREIAAHRTAPGELYAAIHGATAQLMPADTFMIILFSRSEDEAHDVYLCARGIIYPGESYPRQNSFADFVVRRGQPLLIENFASFDDYPLDACAHNDITHSGLAVPLQGRTRTHGIIFTRSNQVGAYDDEDVVLLELLAAHAATALENGALFAEIERLATTDALTGLANRRHFFAQARLTASGARQRGQPLAIALIDLDHFKLVNDTYGHQAGDLVLQLVAQTCRECVRSGDLVGRYGGEELALLMPNTDSAGGGHVAERIREAIASLRIKYGDDEISVTASFGIATDHESSDIDLTLARADAALYAAKEAGRNRVVVCRSCRISMRADSASPYNWTSLGEGGSEGLRPSE